MTPREWLDGLLAVLLAPVCAACHAPLPHPTRGCVCANCWTAIVPTPTPHCTRCGDHVRGCADVTPTCEHCRRTSSLVTSALAIGPHEGALRSIVHALKYDARRSLAQPLASLMRAAAAELVRDCDVIVPVPLHPARRRARGFNQADDLARHIGPEVITALRRVRHTGTQTALPSSARRANVDGVFRTTHCARVLAGATVLLVDDVRTTGATLEACAGALKEAGVREVRALTAARVGTPGS
jgi:ComF family protein